MIMTKFTKSGLIALAVCFIFIGGLNLSQGKMVLAQGNDERQIDSWWEKAQRGGLSEVGRAYGESTPRDPRNIVVDMIRVVLGFLGVIAVVLILYAGFKWMTSRGNEETIGDAKKTLIAGAIGLAIILLAYSLVSFVLKQLIDATTHR